MNKQNMALLLTLLTGSSLALAQAPDVLYKNNCALCHGRYGEKAALGKARPLQKLTQQEIAEALRLRKAGEIVGIGNKAKARLSDEEITAVAEFVPTLKR